MNSGKISLEIIPDIREVDPREWNRLASQPGISPFLEHEFLASLESSAAVSPQNGWYPLHVLLREGGQLRGAAPLYGKTHSWGEFVFDQAWAQAAEALHIPFYPKLVGCLPFTPSPGYRFLLDPGEDQDQLTALLLGGMRQLREEGGFAGLSFLFVDPQWEDSLARAGGMDRWAHQYFLWERGKLEDFDAYCRRFKKKQRRNIERERRAVQDQGITIKILSGKEINDVLMGRMFDYYQNTNENYGPFAAFYLNRDWFLEINRIWSSRLLLIGAWKEGQELPAALGFFVRKGKHLTGRYWGAGEFVKHLHFELCYYAPLEWALKEGIETYDPGMGSHHKARRGFVSREFGSYHEFGDPALRDLFRRFLPQINESEREAIGRLNQDIPFKERKPGPEQEPREG